jgi:ribonuclease HII
VISPHLEYELALMEQGYSRIAGLDEAGRGAWAGPVMAGAAILPLDRADLLDALRGVRDSKLCTPTQRDSYYETIRAVARATAAGMASPEEIDQMGIAAATRLAMRRAVEALDVPPEALLIDWLRLREVRLPQQGIRKGDQVSLSIAAASIVAKVTRDRLMASLDAEHPGYGFARHKGYGTAAHRAALGECGPCAIHRRSFAPIAACLIAEFECADPRPRP